MRIFIVTGEASGDLHGANLAKALYHLNPQITIEGVGGHKMAAEGVELIPDIERVDAMGLPGLKQLTHGVRTLHQLKRRLWQTRYHAIVLIDSPGMNLRLAKTAVRAKQRVIYYIAPQVWAWGSRRLKLIKRVVDRMIVILPFEESFFRQKGIRCDFVGHPLLDVVEKSITKEHSQKKVGLESTTPVLGLLPGSREKEIQYCLPTMLEAASRLLNDFPDMQVVIGKSTALKEKLFLDLIASYDRLKVKIIDGQPTTVMASADLLFVTSGTATLQAAIVGTPMIIVYRASPLTFFIARRLVKIPYIGLVNIVAGRLVAPELIQEDMTAERLTGEARRLLQNPDLLDEMQTAFREITESLGSSGASSRAAKLVLEEAMG